MGRTGWSPNMTLVAIGVQVTVSLRRQPRKLAASHFWSLFDHEPRVAECNIERGKQQREHEDGLRTDDPHIQGRANQTQDERCQHDANGVKY